MAGKILQSLVVKSLNPALIRFSQTSVNGVKQLVDSMRKKGWKGDPINVVRMPDGGLTAFDNTRVLAASRVGIAVKAIIRNASDPFPVGRWTAKNGVTPATWGEAVAMRIQQQSKRFREANPYGSFVTGSIE